MISRILVVDPMKRISIPEVRRHPWFQKHLPLYIANPPSGAFNRLEKASKIPLFVFWIDGYKIYSTDLSCKFEG